MKDLLLKLIKDNFKFVSFSFLKTTTLALAVFLLGLLFIAYIFFPKPLFDERYSPLLLDDDGKIISANLSVQQQWYFPPNGSIDDIHPHLKEALLQYEDQHFYIHPGVNPVSIGRALLHNFTHPDDKRIGASTISMQVIRLARKAPRTYIEKFKEICFALILELKYTKDEILFQYLSHAPFGSNIIGYKAAIHRYFGYYTEDLSWGEACLLAILPNQPGNVFPGRNNEILLKKRNLLLKTLLKRKIISQENYNISIIEPIPDKQYPFIKKAPHLLNTLAKRKPHQFIFRSTINTHCQEILNSALSQANNSLAQLFIRNSCALLIDSKSGAILGYVGNTPDYLKTANGFVDIITKNRSTGSTLKPILFAAELAAGESLPYELVKDIPISIDGYAPDNFNKTFNGLLPNDAALRASLNIPAVLKLKHYGLTRFHHQLTNAKFKSISEKEATRYGLSLIIGGAEATPLELGSFYNQMAQLLQSNASSNNTSLYQNVYVEKTKAPLNTIQIPKAISKGAVFLTAQAIGSSLNKFLGNELPIAWKTGTSFGHKDAWTIGFNAQYTLVVWLGNADGEGRPEIRGRSLAAPIFFDILNRLPQNKNVWFQFPKDELQTVKTCAVSGYLFGRYCQSVKMIFAPKGSIKTKPCPFHQIIHLNQDMTHQVNSNCYPTSKMKQDTIFKVNPIPNFYLKRKLKGQKFYPWHPLCMQSSLISRISFIYPRKGQQIYLPKLIDGQKGSCILRVACNTEGTIYWYLNKRFIGKTTNHHELPIKVTPGKYDLEVVHQEGFKNKMLLEML